MPEQEQEQEQEKIKVVVTKKVVKIKPVIKKRANYWW